MSSTDPKLKLDELHQAAERVAANLVELEVDPERQLVEAASLEGVSADRAVAAGDAVTELWRRKGLLEGLLQKADKLRSSRKTEELSSLLDGPSIELASTDVPLAERELLGSTRSIDRCSPDALLAEMASSFEEVKAVISQITGVWTALNPRLEGARSMLEEAGRLADEAGGAARVDVESAGRELATVSRATLADPLSVDPHEVDGVASAAEALRDALQADLALRRNFDASRLEALELVTRLASTERDVAAAQSELGLKIAGASAPPLRTTSDDRATELEAVRELAATGRWREARTTLAAVRSETERGIARAEDALAAARGPLEARNQLRGLLDAYQVKAKRTGRLEDPRVAEIFSRAQDCLYTAPTDLALAAQLVRSYQDALQGAVSDTGVPR
jgi:hypothetical protein